MCISNVVVNPGLPKKQYLDISCVVNGCPFTYTAGPSRSSVFLTLVPNRPQSLVYPVPSLLQCPTNPRFAKCSVLVTSVLFQVKSNTKFSAFLSPLSYHHQFWQSHPILILVPYIVQGFVNPTCLLLFNVTRPVEPNYSTVLKMSFSLYLLLYQGLSRALAELGVVPAVSFEAARWRKP